MDAELKRLLELSAKAMEVDGLAWVSSCQSFYFDDPATGREAWRPDDRDGQSRRLQVKLQIDTTQGDKEIKAFNGCYCCAVVKIGDDAAAAMRRAVLEVAAQVGEVLA